MLSARRLSVHCPRRLRVVRLFVEAGPEGMAAGALGEAVNASSSNLSFLLKELGRARLIRSRRQTRSIIYSASLVSLVPRPWPDMLGAIRRRLPMPEPVYPLAEGGDPAMDAIIYHNPECGTSRNTLALIRNAGIEPHVIDYLKTPPSRALLKQLINRMGVSVREVLREKETPYADLGLSNPELTDDELLDAMMAHPILINRPIVVTPNGVKLCRPSEAVLDILPVPQRGPFSKEDGEPVIDEYGRRVGVG
jgi:arsenate reductase